MNNFDGPYTHKYVVRDIPKLNKIKSHENYHMVEENIHVIKNFIKEEEYIFLNNLITNANENDWLSDDNREWWNRRVLPIIKRDQENIAIVNLVDRIKNLLDEPTLSLINGLQAIHRLNPNEGMFEHCDNPIYEDYEITKEHASFLNLGLQYALTLYINDFSGGEVYYPNLGITYKPEKGDILWHPGNKRYTHGVNPVTGNSVRYIMTTFVNDTEIDKKNNKIVGWDDPTLKSL